MILLLAVITALTLTLLLSTSKSPDELVREVKE